ncbi:MAG: hypothetical protein MR669_07185 [Selenomonadaceae bacterium]|nr:hypothetical protein [Selenomonadaceae bacterium]
MENKQIVETGYTFSRKRQLDGIKISIAIETQTDMAMPLLLTRCATLTHCVYLDMARDINERKH